MIGRRCDCVGGVMKKSTEDDDMKMKRIMCGIAAAAFAGVVGVCGACAQAAAAAETPRVQTETSAPISRAPVTIVDHDETLTMELPAQISDFKKEEQSFTELGFSISKYLARAEGAGLDVLVQHTVFGDAGDNAGDAPTHDEAAAGARDAIAAAYQYDQMMRDETIDLGGTPAHLFSYAYMVGGTRYVDDSVLVVLGTNQWNITLSRRADDRAVAPHIDEMLTSIRVTTAK